jgi:hypothetical protein
MGELFLARRAIFFSTSRWCVCFILQLGSFNKLAVMRRQKVVIWLSLNIILRAFFSSRIVYVAVVAKFFLHSAQIAESTKWHLFLLQGSLDCSQYSALYSRHSSLVTSAAKSRICLFNRIARARAKWRRNSLYICDISWATQKNRLVSRAVSRLHLDKERHILKPNVCKR